MIETTHLENKQGTFLPLELAIKYYKKWDCEIQTKEGKNGYYKCLQGDGEVFFDNNNHYKGKFMNGLMHGQGKFQWSNGLIYQGPFENNGITGKGKYSWPDGSTYQGMLLNGKRNGKGQYYCSHDHSRYNGEWKNGVRDGYGCLIFKGDASYEGQFKNGLRHGKGKMKYASGNQYEGEWINDKKQGYGIMNWYNAHQKYEGQWKNDQQNGLGTYYWFDGKIQYKIIKNIYKGYWVNGQRKGFGCFYYSNGCRFQGNFDKNKKNGMGIIMDQYGNCKVQNYKDDKIVPSQKQKKQVEEVPNKINTTNKLSTPRLPQKLKLPQIKRQGPPKSKQKDQNEISIISNNPTNKPKQICQNQYKNIIDLGSSSHNKLIDQKILNYLLRENSKLRAWYKYCSSSSGINGPIKQFYTGMISQNLWKLIKDLRLVDEYISISKLNRIFTKGSKSLFDMNLPNPEKLTLFQKYQNQGKTQNQFIELSPRMKQNLKEPTLNLSQIHYSEIQWIDYCLRLKQQIQQIQTKTLNQKQYKKVQEIQLNSKNIVHDNKRIILFRHFVCYLLQIAILQYERELAKEGKQNINANSHLFRQKLQELFNMIHKLYLADSSQIKQKEKLPFSTDNLTLQSNQRSVVCSEDYEKINSQVFVTLTKNQKSLVNSDDRSVTVKVLYTLLDKCQILKDSNEKILFLEKIERSMSINGQSILKKQMKQHFSTLEKVIYKSPVFEGILNYPLIQKEFSDLLYQAVNRRINGNNKEEAIKKYKDLITILNQSIQAAYTKSLIKGPVFKTVLSDKDKQKQQLWRQHQKKLLQEKEKNIKKIQEQNQGRQRLKMQRQDFRWEDNMSEQDQQSEEYFD